MDPVDREKKGRCSGTSLREDFVLQMSLSVLLYTERGLTVTNDKFDNDCRDDCPKY